MADLRRANGRDKPWTVDYFAVGNETWGCGGNMVPEYYANLYKHYQTFVKQFNPDKKIKKLAVGPTDKDYNWTETMLRECFRQQGTYPQNFGYMDGLTLHYYTLPYDWDHKGSATKFNDKEWYMTLAKTFAMEEFIEKPLGTWVIPTREGLVYCRSIGAAIAVIEEEFDAVEDKATELTALRLDEKEVGWEQAFWVRRYTISRYCGSFSVDAERVKV